MASKQVKFENLLESDLKKKENSNAKSSTKKSSESTKDTNANKKTDNSKSKVKTTNSKSNSKKTDVKTREKLSGKASNKKAISTNKTATKKTTPKRVVKGKNSKIIVSQEDMDKLCEVYDWYMQVKDLDILKEKTKIKKTSIEIEENIIKEKKRISAIVDNEIWSSFDRLCNNTEEKKGDMLTFAIKDFLLKHKDLI